MPGRLSIFATVFLLFISAIAHAGPVDEALIAQFETATTLREQHKIAAEIRQRLNDGPLSVALTDRLVGILMSKQSLAHQNIIVLLRDLDSVIDFSENSIISIAGGLSGEVVHNYAGGQAITTVLTNYQKEHSLPKPAFVALISALHHQAMLNRSAAIDILAAMPADDQQRDNALTAIVDTLSSSDHQHTRSKAVAALARMVRDGPLPENAVAALASAASTDSYMTVRMDALELLATLPLDNAVKKTVSLSLARELITPTPQLWVRSRGLRSHTGLESRAIELLKTWLDPPYPPYVIDALIAQAAKYNPDESLALLKEIRSQGGLSDEHLQRLEQTAANHRQPGYREAIYQLVTPDLEADSLIDDALVAMENARYLNIRIKAAYTLKRRFAGEPVPMRVADTANRIMHSATNNELRGIAAVLVSRGDENFAVRERKLLAGLAKRDDAGIQQALLDLYGGDGLEELIVRYAADASVPASFRGLAINALADEASPDKHLSSKTREALRQAAWSSSEYWLINSLEKALIAWNIDRPFILHMKKRKNQTNFLFGLWGASTIINLVGGLVAFVFLFQIQLQSNSWFARRTVMVVGWLAVSAGMLFLMALGLLGFAGHNSLPSPISSLKLNIPMYIGTVIYLTLACIIFKRAKKQKASLSSMSHDTVSHDSIDI